MQHLTKILPPFNRSAVPGRLALSGLHQVMLVREIHLPRAVRIELHPLPNQPQHLNPCSMQLGVHSSIFRRPWFAEKHNIGHVRSFQGVIGQATRGKRSSPNLDAATHSTDASPNANAVKPAGNAPDEAAVIEKQKKKPSRSKTRAKSQALELPEAGAQPLITPIIPDEASVSDPSPVKKGARKKTTPKRGTPEAKTFAAIKTTSSSQSARAQLTYNDLFAHLPAAGHPAYTKRHWVVFSDLHVQEKSLNTCLAVLDRVLQEAVARDAGVLFLGDWWHERGAVAFNHLNPCLQKTAEFTAKGVPMLMLVGNHDQVDLRGHQHGLTCLELGLVHVFTGPALFRNALWLPYRRQHDELLQAKQLTAECYQAKGETLTAVFAHADVAGARYNAHYQAKDGMTADQFPSGVPVYTGHYHYPQQVPGTNIIYIGSPYEVSAAEAGQQKRLLVLDAEDGWKITEEIPIQYGPKHVIVKRGKQLTQKQMDELGPDSIVRLSVTLEEQKSPEFEALRKQLEAKGAKVQTVVELEAGGPRLQVKDDDEPAQLLEVYRAARPPGELGEEGMQVALQALQDAAGARMSSRHAAEHVHLQLDSVELQGFGPFVNRVEYPLSGRGLKVVTGRNEDDAGLEGDVTLSSNGSGKSSLVSAPLWALTGEMTTRTESGGGRAAGLVEAMLNDSCNEAEVVLHGRVGGKPFTVERAVKRKKGTSRIKFVIDGQDMTAQDKKATQDIINRELCTHLLRYQAFVGQNDVQTLLEASDKDFKALLSQVIEMEVWDSALETLKPKVDSLKKHMAAVSGRLDVYRKDVATQQQQIDTNQLESDQWQQGVAAQLEQLQQEHATLTAAVTQKVNSMKSLTDPFLTSWQDVTTGLAVTTQRHAALLQAGPEAVPPIVLPPAPTLESTRQKLLAEQQQQQQQQAPTSGESNAVADEASASDMQPQPENSIDNQQQQDAEKEVEATLQATLNDAISKLRAADREHAAAKQKYLTVQQELDSMQAQANNLDANPVCVTCKQPVDAKHLQRHVQELTDKQQGVKVELDAAAAQVKSCKAGVEAAQQALADAANTHKTLQEQRHQKFMEQLRQQQAAASAKQAAQKQEQEKLQAAHAIEEAKYREAVSKLQAEYQQNLQAAQNAYKVKVFTWQCLKESLEKAYNQAQEVNKQLATCQKACVGVQAMLPKEAAAELSVTAAMQMPQPVPMSENELEVAHMLAWTESSRELGKQSRELDTVTKSVVQDLEKLSKVCKSLQDCQSTTNPHEQILKLLQEQQAAKQQDLVAAEQASLLSEQQLTAISEAQKALGREGVQSFILERVLAQLQNETEHYLSQLSDTLRLELKASRPTAKAKANASKKRATKKKKDGSPADGSDEDGSQDVDSDGAAGSSSKALAEREQITKIVWYQAPDGSAPIIRDPVQLSGGERRRVALALLLGFGKLLRDSSRLKCNLLVLDEGLQQLDSDGCRRVVDILRDEPYDTVLLVAQAQSFVTMQEHDGIDVIVKSRGYARVEQLE